MYQYASPIVGEASSIRRGGISMHPPLAFGLWSKRRDQVFGGRWLVRLGFDRLTVCVERPEAVPENIVGVVKFLDLAQPVPVLAKAALGAFRRLVATEELGESP